MIDWIITTAAAHGVRDWFSLLANVATVAGVFAAIWGGIVALRSYQFAQRSAANSHMHGLFCDYLKTEYETQRPITEEEQRKLTAMMLYTLEEMYIWVLREESLLNRRTTIMSPKSKKHRRDGLNGWRSTIAYHAKSLRPLVINSLLDYASCYSVRFLQFVSEVLHDPVLESVAAEHERKLDDGQPRPRGRKEGELLTTAPTDAATVPPAKA